MKPAVSVLIAAYNAAKYISETIESVLAQTFEDFELIIVDDCSFDNTAEIIFSFNDPRIRYFKNDSNKGISFTRNRLIYLAQGDFLAILDADDIALPNRLEIQQSFLKNNPAYVLVCSWFETIDESGNTKAIFRKSISTEEFPVSLLFSNKIAQSSVMLNAKLLPNKNNLYNIEFPPAEDYELWVRLLKIGKLKMIPEILLKYRDHQDSASYTKKINQKSAVARIVSTQLANLNIAYSEREFNIQQSFIDQDIRKNKNISFFEVRNWLFRLKVVNLDSKVYPAGILDQWINEKLMTIFNSEFQRYHPMLIGNLFKHISIKKVSFKILIKAVIKCMIFYVPKNTDQ